MVDSAGTLLYRITHDGVEVLLVHPSGNYNRNAPWSIPKGIPDEAESLESAARRETLEEAGVTAGELASLSHIDYRSRRKRVYCFAGPAPNGASPQPSSWEVDQARFVTIDAARRQLHPDQRPFLDRLEDLLRNLEDAS